MEKYKSVHRRRVPRRKFLKESLLAGTSAYIALKGEKSLAKDPPKSPPTRPFVEELPIAPIAQPVAQLDPPPSVTRNPRLNDFPPQKFYELREREAFHSFHPDLPSSLIWGFNGIFPGPTFHVTQGEPILVRIHNDLPANHVGFGSPDTSTHLHGGHTPAESDGFPADFYPPGQFKDFHYPNLAERNMVEDSQGTLWYHDHREEFTAQNVYKGLAGFYLLFDLLDSGNEQDPNPVALRLPSGEFDVPLIFTDEIFKQNGELFFDPFNFNGLLGDKFSVNGKIQPFFKVARRKYRFRLLNASASRFYEFFLSSKQPFLLIATDGNLLKAPLRLQSIRIAPAERMDVIVDFSQSRIGDQIFLENRLEMENEGRRPADKLLKKGIQTLRFDVDRDAPDPSRIPLLLRPQRVVNLAEVVKRREWIFDRRQGMWTVNNELFDADTSRAQPKLGTAEIWTLETKSGGWAHPIHIHLEEFKILSRNGKTPPPQERGWKDVVDVGPNEKVVLFIRFQDFAGRYVMHCHNLVHEDHAMMIRWDTVP